MSVRVTAAFSSALSVIHAKIFTSDSALTADRRTTNADLAISAD
jgi:hypothetical protein